MSTNKRTTILTLSTLLASAAFGGPSALAANQVHYRVKIRNVTAGNLLSPFLAVALKPSAHLFEVAHPATQGIAAVAETGNTSILEAELSQNPAVLATAKAAGGPVGAAGDASAELVLGADEVNKGATFNLVAMIGKSNDSFVAIRGLSLATVAKYGSVTLTATNFDAGSEENTGNTGDFGSGGHPVAAAEGHISYDRGLNLRGDAPETLAWGSVAAIVTVDRIQ